MPLWSTTGGASKYGFFNPAPPLPIIPGATVYLDGATPTSYSGSGSTIIDVTGNGNNGTIIGGATYSATSGGSWFLDGKSGFIRVGPVANSGISTTSYSMSLWVAPMTQVGNLVGMAQTEPSDGWQMPPMGVRQQRFLGKVWSNNLLAQSTAYTIGTWYYVTLVWDATNSQQRFYVNGTLIASQGNVSYNSSGVSNYLNIGKNIEQAADNYGWFRGWFGAFHFYGGTALTDAQVLFNYNATSARFATPPGSDINTQTLGLYLDTNKINSWNNNTTWTDLSGNNLNMTGPTASQLTLRPIAQQTGNIQDGGLISPGGLISNGGSGGGYWVTGNTTILDDDTHTIMFWIKFNSSTAWPNGWNNTWEKFFTHNSAGTGACCGGERSPSAWRYPQERKIHFRYDPGNSSADTGPANIPVDFTGGPMYVLDTWYHMCWTKNGATATAYVNGSSIGTSTVSNPKLSVTNPIGFFEAYGQASAQVDGLMVYDRVLPAGEVAQNYTAQRGRYEPSPNNYRLVFEINANNPASYPGTGTSVFETSGRQLTGTMSNVTYNGDAINYTGTNVGGYWTFNGSTSFISFPYDSIHDVGGNGVTAEVWVKPANFSQNGFFIEKGQVNSQYSLFLSGAQLIWRTVTSGNGLTDINVNPNSFMNTTEWHHVVGTYSSGNKKLYINGVLIQTQTNITGTINNNSNGIWLGKHALPDSYFYNGQIGEARIYNRQLSDAQVLYNYNTTKWRYAKASLPVAAGIYSFTSATFTTGGNNGRFAPSISQIRSGVGNPTWASTYLNMPQVGGVSEWTVPTTATYRITANGAGGGGGSPASYTGGSGANVIATVPLTQGDILFLVIGQGGRPYTSSGQDGGGGGGTFISRGTTNNYQSSTLLVAAGGGGGGAASTGFNSGMHGQASNNGGGAFPGTNGNGGPNGSGSENGSGGGGWFGAGSGAQPGAQVRSTSSPTGAPSAYGDSSNTGGFGGGAGGWGSGGGGGGYSGGSPVIIAGNNRSGSGGGGSFVGNGATLVSWTTGGGASQTQPGSIIIERL